MKNWHWTQAFATLSLLLSVLSLLACFTGWFLNHEMTPAQRGLFFVLVLVFYRLHWRFQGIAYELDWDRSERLVSIMQHRAHRTDKEW